MDRPRATVLVRWAAAGLIAGGGVVVLARLAHGEGAVPLIGRSLLGIGALITGALLAAPELVRWAASPISGLLDSILLPSETVHPPVDFKLARFYAQTLRYDEACEEYVRILHYHPDNAEAHLEGIRAAALAGNEPLAAKLYRGARRLLRTGDQRHLPDAVYAARHQLLNDAGEAEPAALPENAGEPATERPSDGSSPPASDSLPR